jgi:small subunit ribosomal protein S17
MPENTQDNSSKKTGGLKLIGTVTSNKMANTVKVKVDLVKVHPKYQKRYRTSKKYAADTAGIQYAIGDKVEIMECKPISKTKNWTVTRKA